MSLGQHALESPSQAAVDDPLHLLRCEQCDVTWRGSPAVPCWFCGEPGAIRSEVRIVAD